MDQVNVSYEPSFKILDSYDYSSIGERRLKSIFKLITPITNRISIQKFHLISSATHDVKRDIYDLSINKYGSQIAIVENQGEYESVVESAVRIYSVGRRKNMEDEADEDDDDMAMSDDGSSDDGSVGKCQKLKRTTKLTSSQIKRMPTLMRSFFFRV